MLQRAHYTREAIAQHYQLSPFIQQTYFSLGSLPVLRSTSRTIPCKFAVRCSSCCMVVQINILSLRARSRVMRLKRDVVYSLIYLLNTGYKESPANEVALPMVQSTKSESNPNYGPEIPSPCPRSFSSSLSRSECS